MSEFSENIYGVPNAVNKKVYVSSDNLLYALNTLRGKIYFRYICNSVLANAPKIHYDTITDDINRIFGSNIQPTPNDKTIVGDPYQWIENADEVRSYIEFYKQQLLE